MRACVLEVGRLPAPGPLGLLTPEILKARITAVMHRGAEASRDRLKITPGKQPVESVAAGLSVPGEGTLDIRLTEGHSQGGLALAFGFNLFVA